MFKPKTFWLIIILLSALFLNRTDGKIDVFIDPAPLEQNFVYSTITAMSVEEEGSPPLEGVVLTTGGGSFISANIIPDHEPEPIIEEPEEIQTSASFETPPTYRFYSCINFIKEYYPEYKDQPLYNPKYLWKHFSEYGLEKIDGPIEGALVVTLDNPYYGHIAIVGSVSETSFNVVEENYRSGRVTYREFDFSDKRIVGFLK